MRPRWIGTREQLLTVIRDRREELDLSMEFLDELAGLPARYSSKVLAPHPLKRLGPLSLSVLLGALALKLVRIEVVEDPEQAAKMAGRWIPRKRRPGCRKSPPTWCVVRPSQTVFSFVNEEKDECSSKTD